MDELETSLQRDPVRLTGQTECVPQDDIIVLHIVLACYPGLDTLCPSITLICVVSTGEQLVVPVRGDPDVMISEFGALLRVKSEKGWERVRRTHSVSDRVGVRQNHL